MVPYDSTIYLGSAAHYRYGRPAYSPELEAVLTQETGLDGNGRLLDVGCGPGVLTVRLAHLFEQAVGLDPDPGMLAEGRRAAEEKNVTNVRWVQGLAEDLPALAPGPYRLVTFGQSFHWTDECLVAETLYDMLESGGALALIVHTVTGRPRPPAQGCLRFLTRRSGRWWVNVSATRPPWWLMCLHRLQRKRKNDLIGERRSPHVLVENAVWRFAAERMRKDNVLAVGLGLHIVGAGIFFVDRSIGQQASPGEPGIFVCGMPAIPTGQRGSLG